jgi:hypothetical protein
MLEKDNIMISKQTISNVLHEMNYSFKKAITKPLLTEKQKSIRLEWGLNHQNYNWNNVIFSDETSIWLRFNNKRWINDDEQDYDYVVKYPIKVHVWGYISLQFGSDILIFTENLDSRLYLEFLNNHIKHINNENDPKHRSKIVTKFKNDNNIQSLDWPSNSPDLNPQENVWSMLKSKIKKHSIKNMDDFKKVIMEYWNEISQESINNTILSMDKRVKKVIESNDWSIDY